MGRAVGNVKLFNHTRDAAETLIFTKNTRLNMTADLWDEIMNWSDEKKLQELEYMANTIPSSWEFVDYHFLLTGVSRGFTHQFVRSRNNSYAQQTMRVLNMEDYDYVYTRPDTFDSLDGLTIETIWSRDDKSLTEEEAKAMYHHPDTELADRDRINLVYYDQTRQANEEIMARYKKMVSCGVPVEDARGILPTNISTNICAKINLRTMTDMAKSRTGGRTQGEYQKIMNLMVDEVLKVHPWTEKFFFKEGRDYFQEIEDWAAKTFPNDLLKKGELLKIVDHMRKS